MSDLVDTSRRIAEAEAVFLDWDGCLATGGGLLPGARDLLLALGPRAYILSNNSTDLPADLQQRLAGSQVSIDSGNILLAGHQTLCGLAASPGRAVHLVAHPDMAAFAAELGVRLSPDDADMVVLLRDTTFTFAKLEAAANAARRCRHIVAANPDLTHPGPSGRVAPETGALLAALTACLDGVEVVIDIVGKPSPALFLAALARAGVEPDQAVMIGDNLDTDGAGSRACGIPFIQVDSRGSLTMAVLGPGVAAAHRRPFRAKAHG